MQGGPPGQWSMFRLHVYTDAHTSRHRCMCTHVCTGWRRRGKPAVVLRVPSASAAFTFLLLSWPSGCLQGAAPEPAWPTSCWGAGYGLDEAVEPDVCSQGPLDGHRLSRTSDQEIRGEADRLSHPAALAAVF